MYDKINKPGKRVQINIDTPKTEQRTLLPGREDVIRCSVLGSENPEPDNEHLLARLAELIVEAYIYTKKQSKE